MDADAKTRALVRPSKQLMALGKAREYLAKTTDLDAVLDLRDQAEAVRHALKVADHGLDAQNDAAEIKIRAERRAGELLQKMDRQKRGRPSKNGHDVRLTLPDMGLEHKEASRFQQASHLPQKQFEFYVKEVRSTPRAELSSIEVRRRAKAYLQTKKQKKESRAREEFAKGIIVTDLAELQGRSFGTVYADPPWAYGNTATRASAKKHYKTMTVAEICDMPIASLVADDAHLHLWTTNAFLRDSFEVIEAWGFEYRSIFVWCKPQIGIGNYWRVSHEFLVLGVRGDSKRFADHNQRSWQESPRGKHSRKPDEFRGMVEKVSPGPYLELFGRRAVDNWTVYGNELEPTLFVQ